MANQGKAAESNRRWRKDNPETASRWALTTQARTLEQAERRYQLWTTAELELASRDDLTAQQVTAMTGRTLYGVRNMRRKIKNPSPEESLG